MLGLPLYLQRWEAFSETNMSHRIEKQFYPNGQLETEITYFDGPERRWLTRHWHPNGTLEFEVPVRNGVPDGLAKYWNDKGELLGQYEISNGTGVQKGWHRDGSLMAEVTWVDGERTGRGRSYFEGGVLAAETYWIKNQQISKKKYIEASQRDLSLPHYETISKSGVSRKRSSKAKQVVVNKSSNEDSMIEKMLMAGEAKEVLEWLTSGQTGTRTLGELPSQQSSIELAKEIYKLGATKVFAVKIDASDTESENTSKLILSLPKKSNSRKQVFAWCADIAKNLGFEPEYDAGQKHIFLMLD